MRNKKTAAVARVRAIVEILDRGFGKSPQELKIDADLSVTREPVSTIELARRVWHLLHGSQSLPDPSKAIDALALASPATLEPVATPAPPEAAAAQPVDPQDEQADGWQDLR